MIGAATARPFPRAASAGALSQIGGLVRPWRRWLLLIGALVLGAALLELVPPVLVRSIVDDHLTLGRKSGLLALAGLYLGATAGVQALTFLYGYLAAAVAQRVLNALRVRLFAHFQRLPAAYFDRTPLGDVISRCTADVETLDTVFTTGVATLVADMFRLVTIAATMLLLSPPLSAVAVLVVPPLVVVTRFFQVRVRDAERANRIAVGLMNTHLQESLRGIEVVQAFGQEASFVARFRTVLRGVVAAYNRSAFFSSLYPPTTALLSASAAAFLLWAGTRDALASLGISLGTLTAFALLLQRFFKPITALGDEWQTVQGALSGAERIFEVLALPADSGGKSGDAPRRQYGRGIVLQDLVFGYVEGRAVLHGIALEVRPGEHVALVGRTGAGKTSALHLLAGLYEPWGGTVAAGGRDPRSLAEDERRKLVGVVPQAVQLFSGSVYENLTLGDEGAAAEDVFEAARIAGADAFIRALPEGYETVLSGAGGGTGAQLSAGQQQLIALARALVSKPAVLLLDEATSAVDAASDSAFREALRRSVLAGGCAVLTVAHRLSTAREADRIILLDRGEIVEEGTPARLIQDGGRFAALLTLEEAGWDWRSGPVAGA